MKGGEGTFCDVFSSIPDADGLIQVVGQVGRRRSSVYFRCGVAGARLTYSKYAS